MSAAGVRRSAPTAAGRGARRGAGVAELPPPGCSSRSKQTRWAGCVGSTRATRRCSWAKSMRFPSNATSWPSTTVPGTQS
jgi:hypothetical protein